METLKIACRGADVLKLEEMTEFQGELKSLSKASYVALRGEMESTGFSSPIHIWKDGNINRCIDGHQRIRVLKSMKDSGQWEIPPLPVVYIDAVNVHEAKRRVLQMISQYGKIESDGLYEFVHDMPMKFEDFASNFRLPEIDMEDFQAEYFETAEVNFNAKTGTNDDDVPEVKEQPRSKMGDLYILGSHRLLCGDSTSRNDVIRLLEGDEIDMVFTDPPYNIDYDPEARESYFSPERKANPLGKIQNDKKSPEEFRAFLDKVYSNMQLALTPGGAIYICHADTEGHHFRNAFIAQPDAELLDLEKNGTRLGARRLPLDPRAHPLRLEGRSRAPMVRRPKEHVRH